MNWNFETFFGRSALKRGAGSSLPAGPMLLMSSTTYQEFTSRLSAESVSPSTSGLPKLNEIAVTICPWLRTGEIVEIGLQSSPPLPSLKCSSLDYLPIRKEGLVQTTN